MRDIRTVAKKATGFFNNYEPIFESGELADLIRLAKNGDVPARTKIVERFERTILGVCSEFAGPNKELAVYGFIGLLKAIDRVNFQRNNGLYAYAIEYIRKEVREGSKEITDPYSGETRIERVVRSHPKELIEQICAQLHAQCIRHTADKVVQAREDIRARRRPLKYYSTTFEGGYIEDIEGLERVTPRNASPSDDARRLFDCFSPYQFSPQLRPHDAVSRMIEGLVIDTDKRAARRLNAMGRRQYSLWLSRKDRRPILQPEIRMAGYAIPTNTAATASDSTEWKSDAEKLRATAEVQPTVFDEKDKWGWYRSRKDHRPKNEIEAANAAGADERKEHDSIRQQHTRHQASGVRRADGGRRGDTRSRTKGHDHNERRDAPRVAHGA